MRRGPVKIGKPSEDQNRHGSGKNSKTRDKSSHVTSKSVSKSPLRAKNNSNNDNNVTADR